MKLDEALRCLLLRKLHERQVEALAVGKAPLATQLASLAETLRVTRNRADGAYFLALDGGREWRVPATEFSFYSRGDRPQDINPPVSLSDDAFEKNLERANHWVDTLIRSHEPA